MLNDIASFAFSFLIVCCVISWIIGFRLGSRKYKKRWLEANELLYDSSANHWELKGEPEQYRYTFYAIRGKEAIPVTTVAYNRHKSLNRERTFAQQYLIGYQDATNAVRALNQVEEDKCLTS